MSNAAAPQDHDVTSVTIEEEMKRSYLDYAMSVIVARALPDVRDGLKPVHRRILFAMHEAGYPPDKPPRKSARVVGDVMGKYHPHGDTAIYDAMVRMAQDFAMRLPLIDGQGNFGSMDGDPAAAMRYTEVRLTRAAVALLEDIDKDTVDFQPNYDDSGEEPVALPARFPNLLVNGAGGIAVGMATNIPPHNLGEVIDACCAYIDNPAVTVAELMELVPAPDFPTGGIIMGRSGIHQAFETGRGLLTVRGRTHMEEVRKDRQAIIVTEVPYQVNKARMVERIAEVVRDKRVEGISELRDESDRDGLRVVIELKRDAVAEVVLNQLFRFTPLQTTFGANMLALKGGRPELMSLKDMVAAFIEFREEVIRRRTSFELGKARDRAHVLVGLALAVVNLDPVIALIRAAADPTAAREQLMAKTWPVGVVGPLIELVDDAGAGIADGHYRLSEAQAKAILDLRLHRLTGLERDKIAEELEQIASRIADYLDILRSRERLLDILRGELLEMKEKFANPRRTQIEEGEFEHDIEDLIQREDMVVTVSHGGYIKRVPLVTYRAQRRGGKGRAGMSTRDEDFVSQVYVVNTHTPVLFFSTTGKVYKLKVYRLPLATPQARGKALVNLLPLDEGETISTVLPLPEDEDTWDEFIAMFATTRGTVRPISLSKFRNVLSVGIIAIRLRGDDRLIGVGTCTRDDDVLLATRKGKAIRFPVADVRLFSGRTSKGVRGIRLAKGDRVISLSILRHVEASPERREQYVQAVRAKSRIESQNGAERKLEDVERDKERAAMLDEAEFKAMAADQQHILSITEKGYGQLSSAYEYRTTRRGGKGIKNMDVAVAGEVVAAFFVDASDQLMLVTDGGQIIRCGLDEVAVKGRGGRGVTLFRFEDDERVVSVAHVADVGDEPAGDEPAGDDGDEPDQEPTVEEGSNDE